MAAMKRLAIMLFCLIVTMLLLPLLAVHTIRADAGMLVVLVLFFALYPAVSVFVGVLSGRDIRHFWFMPLFVAVFFWLCSFLTYQTAFPAVYSVIYCIICGLGMVVTWFVQRKNKGM